MAWIKTISYQQATGKLKKLYDRVKGPNDNVDNIMMSHSLRPHSMEGHMAIYKYVLHHNGNTLPKWFLEVVGVYVSLLNRCEYCVEHHSAGLKRLLVDDAKHAVLEQALRHDTIKDLDLPASHLALLDYARRLTLEPDQLTSKHIDALRRAGADDGEILEINQVTAYFCYANRTVLGLGVNTDGDILGLSPSDNDDPANWSHR